MSRTARVWIGVAVFYGFMAVLTFGRGASHHHCSVVTVKIDMCGGDTVIAGISGSLLWPLYWSWELQS